MSGYYLEQNLFRHANKLKSEFNNRFDIRCQKETPLNRCTWDYWYVRDQFNYFVSPAYSIFEKSTLDEFEKTLLSWIFDNLGCTEINSMWCSNYTHSCGQNLHMDLDQGMWAYVFSLTDWQHRKFTGGETVLLRPEILKFWQNLKKIEEITITSATDRIYTKIPARFNQLLVFDGRIPHGVQTIMGTNTVTEGRMVIHGWIKPAKFLVRQKNNKKQNLTNTLLPQLKIALTDIFDKYAKLNLHGILVNKVSIRNGQVKTMTLPSTIQSNDREFKLLLNDILNLFEKFFEKRKYKHKDIIIPILFDGENIRINS